MANRLLHKLLLIALWLVPCMASAQPRHLAYLQIDNDAFLGMNFDRYYTNGLHLGIRSQWGASSTPWYFIGALAQKAQSKSLEVMVGQRIFTARSKSYEHLESHDRPFAGWLFAKVATAYRFKGNKSLTASVDVGVIGPMAGSQWTQELIHRMLHMTMPTGWPYQIQNHLAINFGAALEKNHTLARRMEAGWKTATTVGTSQVFIDQQLHVKWGNFQRNGQKANPVYGKNTDQQLYLTGQAGLRYVFYNSLIQGSLHDSRSPYTTEIDHLLWRGTLGIHWAKGAWETGFSCTGLSREVTVAKVPRHFFGTISLGYVF